MQNIVCFHLTFNQYIRSMKNYQKCFTFIFNIKDYMDLDYPKYWHLCELRFGISLFINIYQDIAYTVRAKQSFQQFHSFQLHLNTFNSITQHMNGTNFNLSTPYYKQVEGVPGSWQTRLETLDTFLGHLNRIHVNIKFTMLTKPTNLLLFLDDLITNYNSYTNWCIHAKLTISKP